MRRKSKIKQTWLSTIFVEVFYMCAGEVPVLGALFNILGTADKLRGASRLSD